MEEKFQARTGQVTMLKDLIGGDLLNAAPQDVTVRLHLINMLMELLSAEEVDASDIVELLDDWMEDNFSVIADEQSHG